MRACLLLFLITALGACSAGEQLGEPSLAPRPAEQIDPRLPVADTSAGLPASAALQRRLATLVEKARAAQASADRAIAAAESAASRAGAPHGEGWIAAQQLLSAAIAARYPVVGALSEIDAITASSVNDLVPADLANVQAAAAAVGAIDRRQAERITAVGRRLDS